MTVQQLTAGPRALARWVLRLFTRQPSSPWLPVAFYGSLGAAGLLWNLLDQRPPLWTFLVGPVVGFLLWTLVEYVLHSQGFHRPVSWQPLKDYQGTHWRHHDVPHDPQLIVARLAFSLPLALILWSLLALVLWSWKLALLPLAGLIVGYLSYELVHYGIHRWRRLRWLIRPLVRHHLYHHHKDDTRCFGVTTPLWDWVFRTGRPVAQPVPPPQPAIPLPTPSTQPLPEVR